MRRWRRALAVGGLLMAAGVGRGAVAQDEQAGFDPVLDVPSKLDVMLVRAEYEGTHLRCQDAGRHIHAVLAAKPDWAGAQAMLLMCDVLQARRVDERDDLNRLIALQPDNPAWWQERANVYASYLYWDEAIADITHAIQLRPRTAELYRQRSKWKAEKGDVAGEFDDIDQMHRLNPELGSLWEEMADLAKAAGKSEADEMRYRKLAVLNPKVMPDKQREDEPLSAVGMSVDEMMLRAGYAQRLKKSQLELRFLNAALTAEPKLIRTLEMRLMLEMTDDAMSRAGAYRKPNLMDQDLDLLIQLYPSRPYYLIKLQIAERHGDLNASRDYYTRMLALEPYAADLYESRAGIEGRMKLVDAEIEDHKRAVYLMPGNAGIFRELAPIFDAKKDYMSERVVLDLALIAYPNDEGLKRQRAKLGND